MGLFGNGVRLDAPELLRPIRPATFGQAVGGFFNNFMHPNTSTTLGRIGAMGQQMLASNDTLLGQANRAAIAQRTAAQQGFDTPVRPDPFRVSGLMRPPRIGNPMARPSYLGGDPANPLSWRSFG